MLGSHDLLDGPLLNNHRAGTCKGGVLLSTVGTPRGLFTGLPEVTLLTTPAANNPPPKTSCLGVPELQAHM
jgi:hypothetical protein